MRMKSVLSFLLGLLIGFFAYGAIDFISTISAQKASVQKVIVDKDWLKNKIFGNTTTQHRLVNNTTALYEMLGAVEYEFRDKNGVVVGYDFCLDSAYFGYAKRRVIDGVFSGYEMYSVYDTSLYDAFLPSAYISVFCHDERCYLYDSFFDKASFVETSGLTLLKKGLHSEVIKKMLP